MAAAPRVLGPNRQCNVRAEAAAAVVSLVHAVGWWVTADCCLQVAAG
jgi:hypothetical protein